MISVTRKESVHSITRAKRASNPKGLKKVPRRRQMSFRVIFGLDIFLLMITFHIVLCLSR